MRIVHEIVHGERRRTGERVLGAPVARAGRALHGRSARAPARGAFKILGISLLLIDLQHHIDAAFN